MVPANTRYGSPWKILQLICGLLLIIFAFILVIQPVTGAAPAGGISDRDACEIIAALAGIGLLL
jgi:hypothetical protein